MKHPDEHTLELHVLNAESVAGKRAEIEEHCASCAGCRFLVSEISTFYAELDQELRRPDPFPDSPAGRQLVKRVPGLALWEERLAAGPWTGWGRPVRKFRYYIRRHRIAAAGTGLAFAAIAGMGLLSGYGDVSKDVNPAYVAINSLNGHFEVYNRRNEKLWGRMLDDPKSNLEDPNVRERPRYQVVDLDDDGHREVLTTLNLEGEPEVPRAGLHVFNGLGDRYDVRVERRVHFRGTKYEMPVRIEGGSIVLLDTSDRGNPEILLTIKNDRSPNAVVRMNGRGEVMGEFWHQGQIVAAYYHDVDGDRRPELILCGFNDADDDKEPSLPVIIILDPGKITGQQESSVTRGYGYAVSGAEVYYIRLPLTEMNSTTAVGAGVVRFVPQDNRWVFLWRLTDHHGRPYDMEFVFSPSFEPLRVISTTQTTQFYDREFAAGRITTRINPAYLETLRSRVRFWDGGEWREEVVTVGGERAHIGQAGRP